MTVVLIAVAIACAPLFQISKGMMAGPAYVQVALPVGCRIQEVAPALEGDGFVVFYTDYGRQEVRIECGPRTYRVGLNVTSSEMYTEWKLGSRRIE